MSAKHFDIHQAAHPLTRSGTVSRRSGKSGGYYVVPTCVIYATNGAAEQYRPISREHGELTGLYGVNALDPVVNVNESGGAKGWPPRCGPDVEFALERRLS